MIKINYKEKLMHKFKIFLPIFNEQYCIYVHIANQYIILYNDNKRPQVNKDYMKRKKLHKIRKTPY